MDIKNFKIFNENIDDPYNEENDDVILNLDINDLH